MRPRVDTWFLMAMTFLSSLWMLLISDSGKASLVNRMKPRWKLFRIFIDKSHRSKNMIVIYPIPDKLHDDVYPGIDLLDIINQKKEEVSRVRRDSSRNRKYIIFLKMCGLWVLFLFDKLLVRLVVDLLPSKVKWFTARRQCSELKRFSQRNKKGHLWYKAIY